MTFEKVLKEKTVEIKALKKQIDTKLAEIQKEAEKAWNEEGAEAFVNTAPYGVSEDHLLYGGVASITLDRDSESDHYLFIPQLEAQYTGWVPSSYMD